MSFGTDNTRGDEAKGKNRDAPYPCLINGPLDADMG